MAENARKKGMEQQPIPIKKSVSNKQPSLISSTRKIKKKGNYQKVRYAHTSTQCGPFLSSAYMKTILVITRIRHFTLLGIFFSQLRSSVL